ncbi:lipoyl(octanoyl) transferase LipB [Sedimentibacter hydroxybenzoicus DSM 7310]|uniref:Octanoyltransferase n=1 Tax=Sedimentibacter hydroxybenzoicus DSM 7310 TaxID=1123245 RepID=A0A974GW70_SEDHY|nr:lipoyl(octanoyl) transferase LipB [Sedimentibacter hydroxybenzoicus]NYB74167.1 lipoyl(octanoyl) transferase LipB [Sedimentibacter hydroxybenzoicus DSM 7310]
MQLNIIKLGKIEYDEAFKIQQELVKLRQDKAIGDTLLVLEHFPIITVGRSGDNDNIIVPQDFLEENNVKVNYVNRGGDVTYHGPGQIVGYPIIDLVNHGKDLKLYVSMLEDVIIKLLKEEFNIDAYTKDMKYTGVWVDDNKITAIGVFIKRWVTMHGFAFNVNTNLDHFKWIIPCGIHDKGVTSLKGLLDKELDLNTMIDLVAKYFCDVFGYDDINECSLESILQ